MHEDDTSGNMDFDDVWDTPFPDTPMEISRDNGMSHSQSNLVNKKRALHSSLPVKGKVEKQTIAPPSILEASQAKSSEEKRPILINKSLTGDNNKSIAERSTFVDDNRYCADSLPSYIVSL